MLSCFTFAAATTFAAPFGAPPIRIALYNGGGAFTGALQHELDFYETLNSAAAALSLRVGTAYTLENITERNTVARLTRANYDVVIFPGGSGNGQEPGAAKYPVASSMRR